MPHLRNPHLNAQPFFLEGGPRGILLVHGLTATPAEVRPLAERLHDRGYTVSGPLLPGHASTPGEANRYRWEDWAGVVKQAYRELAGRCPEIVAGGESTGALLALRLAAEKPDIRGVLSYAAALRLQLRPLDVLRLRLLAPLIESVPKRGGALNPLWQGYGVNPLKATLQLIALQGVVRKALPRVRAPLLVVQGRLDPTVHPLAAEIIYREAGSPLKELHWMENSLHCVLIEAERDEVEQCTLAFLDRIGFGI